MICKYNFLIYRKYLEGGLVIDMDVVNCIMEFNLEGFVSKYGINRLKGNINL